MAASDVAMIELTLTHPIRLATTHAFDDATVELDTLSEESYKSSIRQVPRRLHGHIRRCHDQARSHPPHPSRPSFNFSVFYYEILNSPDNAQYLAEHAFNDAIVELNTLSEESFKNAILIMQLLRDNLALLTSDMQNSAGEPSDAEEEAGDAPRRRHCNSLYGIHVSGVSNCGRILASTNQGKRYQQVSMAEQSEGDEVLVENVEDILADLGELGLLPVPLDHPHPSLIALPLSLLLNRRDDAPGRTFDSSAHTIHLDVSLQGPV
ncbi:hypothetical protein NMY22_g17237 [Coprinellus aureogranulatus]|nr:hypothetical protein NMY22_g17237 [Coprinellus aureogranulatus]